MGNCSVTKLKGVVDNDMLPTLGWHGIAVMMSAAGDFNNPFGNPTATSDVRIRGNAYFADAEGNNLGKSTKATFHHVHANAAGTFYIDWKDASLGGNITVFYMNSDNVDADAEDLSYIFTSNTIIYSFLLRGHGSIAPLMQKLPYFTGGFQLLGNNIVGDITNINWSPVITIAETGLTGTLESLLQKFASFNAGTIRFEIAGNPGLTYEGAAPAEFFHQVQFDGAGNYTIVD